jgi:hypothetical protein
VLLTLTTVVYVILPPIIDISPRTFFIRLGV